MTRPNSTPAVPPENPLPTVTVSPTGTLLNSTHLTLRALSDQRSRALANDLAGFLFSFPLPPVMGRAVRFLVQHCAHATPETIVTWITPTPLARSLRCSTPTAAAVIRRLVTLGVLCNPQTTLYQWQTQAGCRRRLHPIYQLLIPSLPEGAQFSLGLENTDPNLFRNPSLTLGPDPNSPSTPQGTPQRTPEETPQATPPKSTKIQDAPIEESLQSQKSRAQRTGEQKTATPWAGEAYTFRRYADCRWLTERVPEALDTQIAALMGACKRKNSRLADLVVVLEQSTTAQGLSGLDLLRYAGGVLRRATGGSLAEQAREFRALRESHQREQENRRANERAIAEAAKWEGRLLRAVNGETARIEAGGKFVYWLSGRSSPMTAGILEDLKRWGFLGERVGEDPGPVDVSVPSGSTPEKRVLPEEGRRVMPERAREALAAFRRAASRMGSPVAAQKTAFG